jgi:hypothetical protein
MTVTNENDTTGAAQTCASTRRTSFHEQLPTELVQDIAEYLIEPDWLLEYNYLDEDADLRCTARGLLELRATSTVLKAKTEHVFEHRLTVRWSDSIGILSPDWSSCPSHLHTRSQFANLSSYNHGTHIIQRPFMSRTKTHRTMQITGSHVYYEE